MVIEPPKSVALVLDTRFTPHATTTSSDVTSPSQNQTPRLFS